MNATELPDDIPRVLRSLTRQIRDGEVADSVELLKEKYRDRPDGLEVFLELLQASAAVRTDKLKTLRQELSKKDSQHFTTLWHFTSSRNLPSIGTHGLLSLRELESRGFVHVPSSSETSRQWDHVIHHDEYVHLCLDRNHPMRWFAHYQRNVDDILWIGIDPRVVDVQDTLYSPTNAIKKGKPKKPDRHPRTALNGDPQAEVMVKDYVPVEYLRLLEV